MHRLHPEPEDDDPLSARSADSGSGRHKSGDIDVEITPSTTMTTDAGSLSTTKSNCSSPGSDFHNHPHGHRRSTGDQEMGGRRQIHAKVGFNAVSLGPQTRAGWCCDFGGFSVAGSCTPTAGTSVSAARLVSPPSQPADGGPSHCH